MLRLLFGATSGNFRVSAFKSMRLCKGASSLVGDPHVRTLNRRHYTVLSQGNFLAWRFNYETKYLAKSGLKKGKATALILRL